MNLAVHKTREQNNMKQRILIIDDSDFTAILLEGLLGDDYEVEYCTDGESGVAAAVKSPPNLILMDVEMPGMDGYEACRLLRRTPATERLPIIFISAHTEAADRLAGYEAGGEDYITKPFDAAELSRKIEVVLRSHQHNQALAAQLDEATSTARAAISNVGDVGIIMRFLSELVACLDTNTMADCLLRTMDRFGLDASFQIRLGGESLSRSRQGVCSPLEESVLKNMETCARIVDLGARTAVNFPRISIIVKAMPVDNPDLYGRIKDNLATIADAADVHLQSLQLVRSAITRGDTLLALFRKSMDKLREIEGNYRVQRSASSQILNSLVMEIERSFVSLGLTEDQEKHLQTMVRDAIEQAQSLYDQEIEVDETMRALTQDLDAVLRDEIVIRPATEASAVTQAQDSVTLF